MFLFYLVNEHSYDDQQNYRGGLRNTIEPDLVHSHSYLSFNDSNIVGTSSETVG
jgi:hypothetical protein